MIKLKNILKEATTSDIIKDLDKVKNDLIKKVDVLIAKKKKLYSNVDIESPMSADEKKLNKEIADLFSEIQQLIQQKRSLKKESVNEKLDNKQLGLLKYAYKDIKRINPSEPAYGRMVKHLDTLSKSELQQLADADINFISLLAKNRLMRSESVNENDGVYFKSYTAAIEAARAAALKKGFEIDDDEMFTKVGVGSKKPSVGKTTRVSLELTKAGKPQRKMLHIQVYGMNNGYELNSYIN